MGVCVFCLFVNEEDNVNACEGVKGWMGRCKAEETWD